MRTRRALVAACVPLLLSLAACGESGDAVALAGAPATAGSDAGAEEPEDDEATDGSSEDPSEEPSEEGSADAGSGDVTAPGAELSYGDTATIPITSFDDPDATLDYTVNSLRVPAEQPNKYSTVVHLNVTVTATQALANIFVMPMFDWEAGDSNGGVSTVGFDPACEGDVPTSMSAGQSVDLCIPLSIAPGAEATEVHYTGSASGPMKADPIIWRP